MEIFLTLTLIAMFVVFAVDASQKRRALTGKAKR
jgi:hypothetical protein